MRGTPYRWLDVGKLARLLLPQHNINRIRYFTAVVANRPGDLTQAQRQQAYLRALRTVPDLTIHYGHLLAKTKRRPLARQPETGPRTVEILDTEEKGSDVNLASYLLLNGFEDEYEMAVVVSNDSDLELPIRMARTRLGEASRGLRPKPQTELRAARRGLLVQAPAPGPLEREPVPRHALRRTRDHHEALWLVTPGMPGSVPALPGSLGPSEGSATYKAPSLGSPCSFDRLRMHGCGKGRP